MIIMIDLYVLFFLLYVIVWLSVFFFTQFGYCQARRVVSPSLLSSWQAVIYVRISQAQSIIV